MKRLFVDPRYRHTFAAQGWTEFDRVFSHFFPDYGRRVRVMVKPVVIPTPEGEAAAFFKFYHLQSRSWSFCLRLSKSRREFENYAVFQRLGISAAEPIAWGEERGFLRRLLRNFIITRAVPDACELDDYLAAAPGRAYRDLLRRDLASMVRRMHSAGFYHHDLVARNVLVSCADAGQPRLFLIDCPRGAFASFGGRRKALRDLASLDKSAVRCCSRTERLRFLLEYLGKTHPDAEARALARACLHYRRSRWPEDWKGR
jgi:tRNA A-37 threonylcarbamoyl transferase component Bud32